MNEESKVFGISVRGWLAITIIGTACVMSFLLKKIDEPLYSLVMFVAGMYFGQSKSKQPNGEVK